MRLIASCLSLACLAVLSGAALAADVEVGGKAPDFKATGTDGKAYSLAKMGDAKAVVVCFTCNHCPVAVAYEDRFINFTKKYAKQGVKFVAINVNPEDLEAMKTRVEEKGFNFPYLKDASGDSAKAFGAQVTPHMFLLDKNRKLAYAGAFDDNMDATQVSANYLVDAVDAVLAGKTPKTTRTRPVGCRIRISP